MMNFELIATSMCKYYVDQKDQNGDIAICFCNHPDNPDDREGNCRHSICPIIGEASDEKSS